MIIFNLTFYFHVFIMENLEITNKQERNYCSEHVAVNSSLYFCLPHCLVTSVFLCVCMCTYVYFYISMHLYVFFCQMGSHWACESFLPLRIFSSSYVLSSIVLSPCVIPLYGRSVPHLPSVGRCFCCVVWRCDEQLG